MSTSDYNQNSVKSHETQHPLYVIYSRWSHQEIYEFLGQYGDEKEVGTLKTHYDSRGKDTYKTFVLLDSKVFEAIRDDGYTSSFREGNRTGFSIAKYRIRDDFKLTNKSLCVPIPRELGKTGREVKDLILSKMQELLDFKVMKANEFNVTVNLCDRENDTPGSNAFISFESQVSDETIAIIKAMLHNTYWPDGTEKFFLNCHFARPMTRDTLEGKREDHKFKYNNKYNKYNNKSKKPFYREVNGKSLVNTNGEVAN